jgi:OOP family OmpA-OmpF porin
MKKVQLSILALFACTNLIMAGGDINPITPYEVKDIQAAQIIPVEEQAPLRVPVTSTNNVSPIYVGLGLVAAKYDSRCLNGPAGCDGVDKTGGVLLRVGYDFNKYMGIEARGMITSIKEHGGKIQHIGAFAKPMYPVTDGLNAYGLVGFAKTTTSGTLRKTDVSGLAFGAGLEYDLSDDKKKDAKYDRKFDGLADQEKGFGVFADYERLYYKKNAPDLDAVSVGLTYDF